MGVTVSDDDIQRCHRIGDYQEGKMRSAIVKFKCYKKRMDFLTNKKKLKPDVTGLTIKERREKLKSSIFITEDLSPYRGKVFRFICEYNKKHNLFAIVTTHNGMISLKRDVDDEKWINISSSLDFEDLGIPKKDFEEEFSELLV